MSIRTDVDYKPLITLFSWIFLVVNLLEIHSMAFWAGFEFLEWDGNAGNLVVSYVSYVRLDYVTVTTSEVLDVLA